MTTFWKNVLKCRYQRCGGMKWLEDAVSTKTTSSSSNTSELKATNQLKNA